MEYSLDSSPNKADLNASTATAQEESGWTAYFEDFSSTYSTVSCYPENSSCSSFAPSSSLVSDAASGAPWKLSPSQAHAAAAGCSPPRYCLSPRLPHKKKKATSTRREVSCGDSLEDTASSPANSAKIMDVKCKQADVNSNLNGTDLGKRGSYHANYYPEIGTDRRITLSVQL